MYCNEVSTALNLQNTKGKAICRGKSYIYCTLITVEHSAKTAAVNLGKMTVVHGTSEQKAVVFLSYSRTLLLIVKNEKNVHL